MDELSYVRNAVDGSLSLMEANDFAAALALLDEAITEAARRGWNRSIQTLCHHAAVLCRFSEDLPLRKHYYELSLRHNPGSHRALYGLATIALDEGQTALARQYAKQAYDAIVASDDPIAPQWLDLMRIHWPDIVGSLE